jgi:capsular exopolysaccharide synthesis family protein
MTESMNQNGKLNQGREWNTTSPREIIFRYLHFAPWILLSIFLFLAAAFIKLRYSPDVYSIVGTLLVKESKPEASGSNRLNDIFFSQDKNLDDEIQLIRSSNISKRVVRSLNLQTLYFNKGKVRSSPIYKKETPLTLSIVRLKDSLKSFTLPITILDDNSFTLGELGAPVVFGQPFETREGVFRVERTTVPLAIFASNAFLVSYATVDERGRELIGAISASPSGESNSILQLAFETENILSGIDIVNQWIREYEKAGLEDKRLIAVSALKFIDDQLDTVRLELSGAEKNLQGFREKNKVYNPEQQATSYFNTLTEIDKEITTNEVRLAVINNMISYLANTNMPYRQVGSTLGIDEPSLLLQINDFNSLQVQRETMLKTTTTANPAIKNIESSIEKLREGIVQNLRNIKQSTELIISTMKAKNDRAGMEVSQIPAKEKQLLDITRRQKILEELYSFLLQKKLETSIASASTISNIRVIEPAMSSKIPVKPNRKGLYTLAFFAGLLLPVGGIFIADILNDKVSSKEEIKKATAAPIIGEIGHAEEEGLVVNKTSRRFIAEQFRIIRTNLQYILPKKDSPVILVTSSSSGEGKSFVSVNIGAVMALAGKKTAILEFDIRKPKVMSYLKLKRNQGITNYIIGKCEFSDLPVPVPSTENLYIIPCGPVPPNPAELFLDDRIEQIMREVREHFDVVIIDTAPVGLVSDAINLSRYSDITLYVVRHDFTHRKQLQLLNELYVDKRTSKLAIVVNDIKAEGGYGKYYGYFGYGYAGYGYGYGSEYFEDHKLNVSLMSRIIDRVRTMFKP